jgi:hypothetical protein
MWRIHWNAEVKNHRRLPFSFENRTRHEKVTNRCPDVKVLRPVMRPATRPTTTLFTLDSN